MFVEPTLDDFAKLLDWHLDAAANSAERAFKSIAHRRNVAGTFRSGGTIIAVFDAVHAEFTKGVEASLGELKRVATKTSLDRQEMRRLTEERLRTFTDRCKSAAKPEMLRSFGPAKPIDARLEKFDAILVHYLRQFDVGFLDLPEPEVPPTMNASIIADTVLGVAIQQGTTHSSQHVVTEINVSDARSAVVAFERALQDDAALGSKRDEISADLNTIKAQLSKQAPSKTIIGEAGKSLRNLVEGAISNALTPPALANAASALWKALGLG